MDHLPTSQLFEERNLLQLLAERNVQVLRAQRAVGLEVHWAHVALRSDRGKEQSSVTGNKCPRGSRLLLTDEYVCDEEWSGEYQHAVCG